jgi:hypothetical protein
MAVGGLIAVTAGLCSLWFVTDIFVRYFDAPDRNGIVMVALPYVAGYGGIPLIVGLALGSAGLRSRRRTHPPVRQTREENL